MHPSTFLPKCEADEAFGAGFVSVQRGRATDVGLEEVSLPPPDDPWQMSH